MSILAKKMILASKSPRRRELFSLLAADFDCEVPAIDEDAVQEADASSLCRKLARLKCGDVVERNPGRTVIGCDTVVEIAGEVLGKPHSVEQARAMLQKLSGQTHRVYTGVCIQTAATSAEFICETCVEFFFIRPRDLEYYIHTDEPYDKAGAYGVQGYAARFLKRLDGDYFNVMGLPVSRLYNALVELGQLL